jgi:hypothetical protein
MIKSIAKSGGKCVDCVFEIVLCIIHSMLRGCRNVLSKFQAVKAEISAKKLTRLQSRNEAHSCDRGLTCMPWHLTTSHRNIIWEILMTMLRHLISFSMTMRSKHLLNGILGILIDDLIQT